MSEILKTGAEAEAFIHSTYRKGNKAKIARIAELLHLMGDPQKKLKFIHIAGSNGKGSTAAMCASILTKAGYKTGMYTSPFIYRFNERMQINNCEISGEELAASTQIVKDLLPQMSDFPSEFEVVTCVAFDYFMRSGCDIVVCEVGLGGLTDATNVIDVPEVAVITNIGLEHTEILGDTLEKIAAQKAGIFKEGGSAVVYRGTPGVEEVFETICRERHVALHKADFDGIVSHSVSLDGQRFDCGARTNLFLPLLGEHQLKNASVTLSVMDTLIAKGWHITEADIRSGLADVTWPGRFEVMHRNPLFIIDGGHNPQCIDALAKNIRDYLPGQKLTLLTGVLADKDYAEMYASILPYAKEFVCITPPSPRKLEAAALAAYLQERGYRAVACASIHEGVETALRLAGADGTVLCFGSLYTIGDVRDALRSLTGV